MRRHKDGVRVNGPYEHGDKWRVHEVTTCSGERTTRYRSYDTRAEAEADIAASRDVTQGVTVRMAVDMFLEKARKCGCAATTVENY